MKPSHLIPATLAALLIAGACGSAAAQAPENDAGLRINCAGDYFRFCSAYFPGSAEISACFIQNFRGLTPQCQGAIRAFDRGGRNRR